MSATYRLPDALVPFDDESLLGLAMRYTELYPGLEPWDLFFRLGLPPKMRLPALLSIDKASDQGRAVLDLLHVPPDSRERFSLRFSGSARLNILGCEVPRGMASVAYRRCCPDCLAKSPHYRAVWLVSALPACSVHGRMLVDCCPACSKRLQWSSNRVVCCPNHACNFDLRLADTPSVTESQRLAVAGFASLIDGQPHAAGWGFADALRVALTIASARVPAAGVSGWEEAVGSDGALLATLLEVGWSTISSWPNSFERYLDELIAGASEREARYGFLRAYGPLVGALRKVGRTDAFLPVLSVMTDRVAGRRGLAVRTDLARRHGSAVTDADRLFTIEEAASQIGIPPETLGRHLGNRTAGAKRRNGHSQQLDQQQIQELKDRYAREACFVGKVQAARTLGVGYGTLVALVAAGIITEVPEAERPNPKLKFRVSDLEMLLSRMQQAGRDKPVVDDYAPEHRVMSQGGFRDGLNLSELVRLTLDGMLSPVAILTTRQGLNRYVFPKVIPERL